MLVAKRPSVEFLSEVKQAGFPLPEFVELREGRIDPASSLCQRKLGSLRPWAWGPDSVELLEPLFANVTGEARTASQRFNERIAHLYSKAWSAGFLRTVLARSRRSGEARPPGTESKSLPEPPAAEPWLCTEDEVGVAVDTLEGALAAIAAIRRRGHHRVVAKEAHGLAGHNAIRLWEPETSATQQRWMAHALQNGRQLVIEPWLERELDFSVQLEMGPRGLKLCGYTGLINDPKGQFQANWAAANYERRIPANVAALFCEPGCHFEPAPAPLRRHPIAARSGTGKRRICRAGRHRRLRLSRARGRLPAQARRGNQSALHHGPANPGTDATRLSGELRPVPPREPGAGARGRLLLILSATPIR